MAPRKTKIEAAPEEAAPKTKAKATRAAPKEEQPLIRYSDYEIQVGIPNEGDDDGFQYETIGHAETFAIARDVAFSLAKQGLRMRYPQSINTRNDTAGWFVAHKDKADGLSDASWEKYSTESLVDRAKIFTNEMKGRSRLGNILGELQGISEQTRSAPARQSIRHAMMEMARASFMPLTSGTIGSIGLNLEPDYSDTLATAAAAMGVQLGDTCPSCGVVHDGGGMTLQELIALADDQWDGDPVAEAMVNVEGVQA